jgi:hypothetical protein
VGGAWVWQNPGFLQQSLGSVFPGSSSHDTDDAAIKALEARVARLEQRPAPADLAPFIQRLDALERRAGPTGAPPPVDLRPLLARLDELEARSREAARPRPTDSNVLTGAPAPVPSEPDLHPLVARLNALERLLAERTSDSTKLDALAAQVQALTDRTSDADLRGKLDQMEHQVSGLTAGNAKLAEGSNRAMRLAQLEAAEINLASGHPLGPVPDAPPALARFASIAPPTEAALRLSFTAASREALKVSLPDTEGKPFLDRVIARLQDFRLITVREGDQVLVGNSTAVILARARVLLDAGDLDGAAKAVATLTGPPADRMAPWLADATALQAAREALASLVGAG